MKSVLIFKHISEDNGQAIKTFLSSLQGLQSIVQVRKRQI